MLSVPSNNPYIPKNLQHIDPVPVDTTAPLSWFAKNGYYVVDNKIFRNKIYAMQEATRKRLDPKGVQWIFNNDIYDELDWKTPSDLSLSEVYRLRAQQLRDKYDYLILSFSGGGDSTNILDSFVLNGIRLDEVVVGWARSQTAGKYEVNLSTDPTNFLSEWDYLVEPKLKWLQSVSPETKITIVDPYENLQAHEPDDDIVTLTVRHNYIGYKRYKAIDCVLLDRQTKHKNCAIIIGLNTPNVVRLKNHLLVQFCDAPTCTWASDYTVSGLHRAVEFFYWTPDMPEVTKVQSHALLNSFRAYPEAVNLIPEWEIGGVRRKAKPSVSDSENLRRWNKKILYPTYNYQSLQVTKNTSPNLIPEWFSWFYDNPHSQEIMQPHQSAITLHQNLINSDFFIKKDGLVHDYYVYRSPLYHVGNLIINSEV
jgi:hypothetical protein